MTKNKFLLLHLTIIVIAAHFNYWAIIMSVISINDNILTRTYTLGELTYVLVLANVCNI
jgi:hypothetical protein